MYEGLLLSSEEMLYAANVKSTSNCGPSHCRWAEKTTLLSYTLTFFNPIAGLFFLLLLFFTPGHFKHKLKRKTWMEKRWERQTADRQTGYCFILSFNPGM